MDQAVWYLGITISNELEKAGHKKQKGEAAIESARKRVLRTYFGDAAGEQKFADPAAMFG